MSISYAQLFHRRTTSQSQPIPGSIQIPNSAGGHAWQVDDWIRLDRFLILGAEGGAYYIGERDLVKQNHESIVRCIQTDGVRVVNRIVEISDSGRAPRNDPMIFVLALVATHGNAEARALAFQNLGKVCRIGTHLFHFAEYVNALRGWGRGLRNAVGGWYANREADDLAFQAVKYQQRDGWSHGDLLRLPKPPTRDHEAVFRWILSGANGLGERTVTRRVQGEPHVTKYAPAGALPPFIAAFEQAKWASSRNEIVKLITEHDLPREAIPTQWLNEIAVWDALLARMPMTALIRNLGKMTSLGLIKPFSDAAKLVVNKLGDEQMLKRARIHPLAVLIAEKVLRRIGIHLRAITEIHDATVLVGRPAGRATGKAGELRTKQPLAQLQQARIALPHGEPRALIGRSHLARGGQQQHATQRGVAGCAAFPKGENVAGGQVSHGGWRDGK